ncbi:phasin family protein [Motiliproteus sp. SC1-56]|uniref:phasin family protein n=1 Tax=Motiliproteus sp. SC1-56 TaxID=2799565 RepID=UPI001A8CECB3|nr:phasin family protein [Motiliproteus sp. SC1-56]
MYKNAFDDMKARMQPLLALAESNKKAMETLANVQKDSMTEVVNASLEQFKALTEAKDPKAAMDLQVQFYKALEAKMTDTAEKSIAAINESREAFLAALQEASEQTSEEIQAAVKKATSTK